MKFLYPLAALLMLAGCDSARETPQQTTAAPSVSAAVSSINPDTLETASSGGSQNASVTDTRSITVTPQLLNKTAHSPASLFQKCAACHGSHAEKSALNQSAVIGEWEAKRIAAAIVGYQDGSYGGAMKTLMHNQVKDLSRAEIEALSEYIAHLGIKTH